MTPPGHPAALETTSSRVGSRRVRFHPGDVVLLADLWALVAYLWFSKVAWNLPTSAGVLAVALFALVSRPTAERTRLTPSALDDVGSIVGRVCVALLFAFIAALITDESLTQIKTLFYVAMPAIPVLLISRGFSYAVERSARRKQSDPVLVVGAGIIARRVIQTLQDHPEYGLKVIGAVDDDPRFASIELGTPVIGGIHDLPKVVRERDVKVVVVAFSASDQGDMIEVIRNVQQAGATIWVIPRLFELGSKATSGDHLWGLPVVRLKGTPQLHPAWPMKRAFDLVLSTIGLIALAPLLAAIAVGIKLEDGGPVLYRQKRLATGGRLFEMLKFRSMRDATEAEIHAEWEAELNRRTLGKSDDPGSDMRITRIGRFLRSTGLDEIPQLWNIVKGDMSLVGPRPERPFFVEELSHDFPSIDQRHRLPVGLTGWSQVHGLRGDDTSVEERFTFDNHYIENWSLTQDLKILLRTARALIRP